MGEPINWYQSHHVPLGYVAVHGGGSSRPMFGAFQALPSHLHDCSFSSSFTLHTSPTQLPYNSPHYSTQAQTTIHGYSVINGHILPHQFPFASQAQHHHHQLQYTTIPPPLTTSDYSSYSQSHTPVTFNPIPHPPSFASFASHVTYLPPPASSLPHNPPTPLSPPNPAVHTHPLSFSPYPLPSNSPPSSPPPLPPKPLAHSSSPPLYRLSETSSSLPPYPASPQQQFSHLNSDNQLDFSCAALPPTNSSCPNTMGRGNAQELTPIEFEFQIYKEKTKANIQELRDVVTTLTSTHDEFRKDLMEKLRQMRVGPKPAVTHTSSSTALSVPLAPPKPSTTHNQIHDDRDMSLPPASASSTVISSPFTLDPHSNVKPYSELGYMNDSGFDSGFITVNGHTSQFCLSLVESMFASYLKNMDERSKAEIKAILDRDYSDQIMSISAATLVVLVVCRTYMNGSKATEWLYFALYLITIHGLSLQEACQNLYQEIELEWVSTIGFVISYHNGSIVYHSLLKEKGPAIYFGWVLSEGVEESMSPLFWLSLFIAGLCEAWLQVTKSYLQLAILMNEVNTIWGASLATCKLSAIRNKIVLYKHITNLVGSYAGELLGSLPFSSIFESFYVGQKVAMQKFMVFLITEASFFKEAMRMNMEDLCWEAVIQKRHRNKVKNITNEDGFAPIWDLSCGISPQQLTKAVYGPTLNTNSHEVTTFLVVAYGIGINLVDVTWKSQLSRSPNECSSFMINFSMTIGMTTFTWVLLSKFEWRVAGNITSKLQLSLTGVCFFSLILMSDPLAPVIATLAMTLLAAVYLGSLQNIINKSVWSNFLRLEDKP